MTTAAQKPLRVFCSYSRKDEEHLNDLRDWLRGLERQGFIESWHDREIVPGWEWEEAIDKNLRTADIILLLVSTPFMASDYVYEKEIGKAVERHERGEARVIPIIVRPAYWKWATFGRLQALPKDAKPITIWLNRDEAWLDVIEGIQKAVEELWAERQEQFASERYREEELARRVAAIYDDGQQHIDAKEWQQALECFEEIQRLQSNHFEASFGKGVALNSLGRYQEALEAYDKVISLDPDYAEAWLNMGDALDNVERHQEALEAYDKAISLDPDYAEAWYFKGSSLHVVGRYQEALEACEKAIGINSDYAEAWYGKGSALDQLGRPQEALEAYDRSISLDPDHSNTWYNKATLLEELGRHQEASEAYDKVKSLDSD